MKAVLQGASQSPGEHSRRECSHLRDLTVFSALMLPMCGLVARSMSCGRSPRWNGQSTAVPALPEKRDPGHFWRPLSLANAGFRSRICAIARDNVPGLGLKAN